MLLIFTCPVRQVEDHPQGLLSSSAQGHCDQWDFQGGPFTTHPKASGASATLRRKEQPSLLKNPHVLNKGQELLFLHSEKGYID